MFMYAKLIGIGVVVAMAITLKVLWSANVDLRAEKALLEEQIEVTITNVELLNVLLDEEREIKEAAQNALLDLRKEVPDVIYTQELPDSIQGVIDRFHLSVRP